MIRIIILFFLSIVIVLGALQGNIKASHLSISPISPISPASPIYLPVIIR